MNNQGMRRDARYAVKFRNIVVNKDFASFEEAYKWAVWNYKGRLDNIDIITRQSSVMTNRDRFLGALWNALNCSHSNQEIVEVMDALNAHKAASRMREVYSKSKNKGTREQAIEDVEVYINFRA